MASADKRFEMQSRMRMSSINRTNHPVPCTVLFFSKNPDVMGFSLIRFETQTQLDSARKMLTLAVARVILTADDLQDVSERQLVHLFNHYRGDKGESLDAGSEIPRTELQDLVFGAINDPGAATPYEETTMSTDAATTEAGTPANKTEAKALEAKAKRDAKEAEKAKRKADAAAKRSDGVIGTIRAALDTTEGTTADEVLTTLVSKFPDRTREGMSSTVKIQFSRLQKSTGRNIINAKIKGRGRVYKFEDKGAVNGEVEVAEVAAPAPAAPVATTPVTDASLKAGTAGQPVAAVGGPKGAAAKGGRK